MYIRFMMGGQSLLEKGLNDCDDDDKVDDSDITDHDGRDNDDDDNDNDDDDDEAEGDPDSDNVVEDEKKKQPSKRKNARVRKQEDLTETIVLRIAQDLVYNVSGGRRWTPKHVGLGSSLQQATRSKKLVDMFHNTGHTISYWDVRRVDTALAKHTLSTMNAEISFRKILQRIITAYDAGRRLDLPRILSHELMEVPLAIADTNGQLRTGNKSVMMELLSSGTELTRGHTSRRTIDISSRWSSIGHESRTTFRVQHF